MIFGPEMVEKILAGEKTVTRRPTKWVFDNTPEACRYQPGRTYAIQPGRGERAVGRLRVLSVRREPLDPQYRDGGAYAQREAEREGFDSPLQFQAYWERLHGSANPSQSVWRIEFELATAPLEYQERKER